MTADIQSPAPKPAALLHVNPQLRYEYLDVLASDPNITFYRFYPETAEWEIVTDKKVKVRIFVGSCFVNLFQANGLAAAQRICEKLHNSSRPNESARGIMAVRDGESKVQMFWSWRAD